MRRDATRREEDFAFRNEDALTYPRVHEPRLLLRRETPSRPRIASASPRNRGEDT